MSTKPNLFTQNLVNGQYQTLWFVKLVRIDRLVNPYCASTSIAECAGGAQRRNQNGSLTSRYRNRLVSKKIDDFVKPAIEPGLHHKKSETHYLVQLNRCRQHKFAIAI